MCVCVGGGGGGGGVHGDHAAPIVIITAIFSPITILDFVYGRELSMCTCIVHVSTLLIGLKMHGGGGGCVQSLQVVRKYIFAYQGSKIRIQYCIFTRFHLHSSRNGIVDTC